MSDRKKELENTIKKARKELNAIEGAKSEERRPELEKVIGKCFVYSNSYGSDSRWPLYILVTGVGDISGFNVDYKVEQFQTCCYGRKTLEIDRAVSSVVESSKSITRGRYFRERKKFLASLAKDTDAKR